jgi:hypothetical protein
MSTANSLPSERAAIVATIDPDAYGTGEELSDAIDMSLFGRLLAIVAAGTLGSSATLDAKLTSSATSGGQYTDIAGKAITQLTQAGTDSDKQALINLDASELPEGHRFVKLSMTVGTATSDAGAIVLGFDPRSAPASDDDLASVDEIVN